MEPSLIYEWCEVVKGSEWYWEDFPWKYELQRQVGLGVFPVEIAILPNLRIGRVHWKKNIYTDPFLIFFIDAEAFSYSLLLASWGGWLRRCTDKLSSTPELSGERTQTRDNLYRNPQKSHGSCSFQSCLRSPRTQIHLKTVTNWVITDCFYSSLLPSIVPGSKILQNIPPQTPLKVTRSSFKSLYGPSLFWWKGWNMKYNDTVKAPK